MKKRFDNVFQFKIILDGITPPIWRRVEVPENYSFWDLHVAIQDAMGWVDYYLHEFLMSDPLTGVETRIGVPDEEFGFYKEIVPENEQNITHWFSMKNKSARYVYDFGDGWKHRILLGKILPRDKNVKYPICTGGKKTCLPEDCGGIWGY
jgi:hypothetical protein